MYEFSNSITSPFSVSALNANLSAAVHNDRVLLCVSSQENLQLFVMSRDLKQTHASRTIKCSELSNAIVINESVVAHCIIAQAERTILAVITTQRVLMYNHDASAQLLAYPNEQVRMPAGTRPPVEQSPFQSIGCVAAQLVAVGLTDGRLLIFSVPPAGNKVDLLQTISVNSEARPICALSRYAASGAAATARNFLVGADDWGRITFWQCAPGRKVCETIDTIDRKSASDFSINCLVTADLNGTSLALAGWQNGLVRIYQLSGQRGTNPEHRLVCEVAAHSRQITSVACHLLDCGGASAGTASKRPEHEAQRLQIATAAEDGVCNVFQLTSSTSGGYELSRSCEIAQPNKMMQGVQMIVQRRHQPPAILLAVYDRTELPVYQAAD